MKISIFAIPQISLGKRNIKDPRLDQVDYITKAKKKTYLQVELVGGENALDADVILVLESARTDLILKDLEFAETRLERATQEQEKALLNKLKGILEKEEFVSEAALSEEEKQLMASYGLYTKKPVMVAKEKDLEDLDAFFVKMLGESGFASFFTTGEKETRAWLIRKGATAWEASGAIHSDIQKGFIRAEIISFTDFIQAGGETQAKQAGKLRLEQKDYLMQDCDLANFRFNK
jgi:ribosome-binding ATPase YchF (GTP1/OBG family)